MTQLNLDQRNADGGVGHLWMAGVVILGVVFVPALVAAVVSYLVH